MDFSESDRREAGGVSANKKDTPIVVAAEELEEMDDEAMMALMGIQGFDSTKGKHVETNLEAGAVAKSRKKRKYRQYMNRQGGFNRSLDNIQ